MKILRAKLSHKRKKIFPISDLTYVRHDMPLREILEGREMLHPIEVERRHISNVPRMGALGNSYVEKEFVVYKGSQRITAAVQLGYTHIEGIIVNE